MGCVGHGSSYNNYLAVSVDMEDHCPFTFNPVEPESTEERKKEVEMKLIRVTLVPKSN